MLDAVSCNLRDVSNVELPCMFFISARVKVKKNQKRWYKNQSGRERERGREESWQQAARLKGDKNLFLPPPLSHHTPTPITVSVPDCRGKMWPIKHRLAHTLTTNVCVRPAHWPPCRHVCEHAHTLVKSKALNSTHNKHAQPCACCRPKGVHHGNRRLGQQDAVFSWHRCVSR